MKTKIKLHKPTVVREEEAQNPPAPRDRLDANSAMRLAMTIEQAFAGDPELGPFTFCEYLACHLGTGDVLPSPSGWAKTLHGFALRPYLQKIAGDSHALACLLDWFAQYVQVSCRTYQSGLAAIAVRRQRAIDHVNDCLQYSAIVYRIEPDDTYGFAVHRIGSEIMQERVVKPAVRLLRSGGMDDALRQYEKALADWAKGQKADAIHGSSNALETVMKTILTRMNVSHSPSAYPKTLIEHMIKDAKLVPEKYAKFWGNFIETIQGVVTVRNSAPDAGHGREPGAPDPDDATVEYAINMAGANIVYLVERWKAATGS